MMRHGPALLGLSVLAVAAWTYSINYDTRAALDRLSDLRSRIAEERENLRVLRVEWAYLNAPERLERLVVEHTDELGLVAMTPEALGYVAAVPYPPPPPLEPAPAERPEPVEPLIAAASPEAASGDPAASRAAPAPGVAKVASAAPDAPGAGRLAAGAGAAEAGGAVAMQAAVAAALAEVGIVTGADRDGAAPVIRTAAAAPSAPVPMARPAAWRRP